MIKIRNIVILILALACIEPYEFEAVRTVRAIVVDASLTNEQKAHLARITYTRAIDEEKSPPVTGASVWIEDENETRIDLMEVDPGYYLTDSSFAGIVGRSYSLHITTADNISFASSEETMRPPMQIDSIYGRYMELPSAENETFEKGLQIFVDSHSDGKEPLSTRYEYTESFETPVPFPSRYDWSGGGEAFWTTEYGKPFMVWERPLPLGTCYREYKSTTTILGTTHGLSKNRLTEYPIKFIEEHEPHLTYKYIIKVKQYSISDEAYAFYNLLRESNESSGSLFDKQKGTVFGNISAVEATDQPILGYFEVAGVDVKKRTFSYHAYVDQGMYFEDWICPPTNTYHYISGYKVLHTNYDTVISRDGLDTIFEEYEYYNWGPVDSILNGYFTPQGFVIWDAEIIEIPFPGDSIHPKGMAYLAHQFCSDCTLYGKLEKPALWDD